MQSKIFITVGLSCWLCCHSTWLIAQTSTTTAIPTFPITPTPSSSSTASPTFPVSSGAAPASVAPHALPTSLPPASFPGSISDKDSTLSESQKRIEEILNFWFGSLTGPDQFPDEKTAAIWFAGTPEIDNIIRQKFEGDIRQAGLGGLNSWRDTPHGRLALILLLDQFPRNIYRNKPQAFAFDGMARALTLEGIRRGDDKALLPIERAFFYLPLQHAEDLNTQNLSVAYYTQLFQEAPASIKPQLEKYVQYAQLHQQIIDRFGRFPYRNAVLGRESTPEETVYLTQQGSLF